MNWFWLPWAWIAALVANDLVWRWKGKCMISSILDRVQAFRDDWRTVTPIITSLALEPHEWRNGSGSWIFKGCPSTQSPYVYVSGGPGNANKYGLVGAWRLKHALKQWKIDSQKPKPVVAIPQAVWSNVDEEMERALYRANPLAFWLRPDRHKYKEPCWMIEDNAA